MLYKLLTIRLNRSPYGDSAIRQKGSSLKQVSLLTKPMERPRPIDTKTLRQLQGEAFLKGFTGKVLDPRVTDILYDNPFALNEMVEGRLIIYKTPEGKDIVDYSPPVAVQRKDPLLFVSKL
jgi:hypothetical protein